MPTCAEGTETQFLTGYVAYLKNGERVYGDMTCVDATHHDVSFTVPDGTLQLFFIVSPAPVQNGEATYFVHKWDGDDSVDDDQWPNRCKVGDEFTIAQALRYKNKSGEVANLVFIFRIHVTEGQIGNRLAEVNYDEATALDIVETLSSETAAAKGGTYDLSGRQINPATALKGIYVSGGRMVLVR